MKRHGNAPVRVGLRLRQHLQYSDLPLIRLLSLLSSDGVSEPVALLALARAMRAGEVEHVGREGVYRLVETPRPIADAGGVA